MTAEQIEVSVELNQPARGRCPNCRRECTMLVSPQEWEGHTWAVCFHCEAFAVYVSGGSWAFPPPALEPTEAMERNRRWASMARGHLERIRKKRLA